MSQKDLLRRLEIEIHRPAEPMAIDGLLPTAEKWPSLLDVSSDAEYSAAEDDVSGLDMEGSVSLEEILNDSIPDAPTSKVDDKAPPPRKRKQDEPSDDEWVAELSGGSVPLDELLGEIGESRPAPEVDPLMKTQVRDSAPAPSPPPSPAAPNSRDEISLDDLIDATEKKPLK